MEWDASQVPSERRVGYEWSASSICVTAFGVDAVESRGKTSPVPINFQSIVIQNSTGFQIGDHNSQSIAITFNQILRGIEEADAPAEVKEEAKGIPTKGRVTCLRFFRGAALAGGKGARDVLSARRQHRAPKRYS